MAPRSTAPSKRSRKQRSSILSDKPRVRISEVVTAHSTVTTTTFTFPFAASQSLVKRLTRRSALAAPASFTSSRVEVRTLVHNYQVVGTRLNGRDRSLMIRDERTCLPNAINVYFGQRLFSSQSGFSLTQQYAEYNNKLLHKNMRDPHLSREIIIKGNKAVSIEEKDDTCQHYFRNFVLMLGCRAAQNRRLKEQVIKCMSKHNLRVAIVEVHQTRSFVTIDGKRDRERDITEGHALVVRFNQGQLQYVDSRGESVELPDVNPELDNVYCFKMFHYVQHQ